MGKSFFFNPNVPPVIKAKGSGRTPLEFHRKLPGYLPTHLVDARDLASKLGLSRLWVKDESWRLGLPAFKILGASWATYCALEDQFGPFKDWQTLDEIKIQLEPFQPLSLATATDGNHGRAVARMARWLGMSAKIFVPTETVEARIKAIEGEGASVEVVDGTYDEAVARAAEEANARCLVISDTSWPGYEKVPGWIGEGYSTIFWEIDDAMNAMGEETGPDVVLVQVGVGALAGAVVAHFRQPDRSSYPKIVSVEPEGAECVLASMQTGEIVTLPGPHLSIMAGLNCGTPSQLAWPLVSGGIDLFLAIPDSRAAQGMRELSGAGVVSGETGAAGLGGLLEILQGEHSAELKEKLGLTSNSKVLVISTEGATDPENYEKLVGHAPT